MDLIRRESELADFEAATDLGTIAETAGWGVSARQGSRNLWFAFTLAGVDVLAMRQGPNAGEITNLEQWQSPDGALQFDYTTPLGPMRTKVAFPATGTQLIRTTTSILPASDVPIAYWPHDLYALSGNGTVHTAQRGLRTGTVFASGTPPVPFSLFYVQDFSSLTDYAEITKRSPSGTVGGQWPELGYRPPAGDDCVLPRARETLISDAYLIVSKEAPTSDEAVAAQYLDSLAQIYLYLPRPEVTYHDWPRRAADALRDLALSPAATYVRQGNHYARPYVGDETKPPESMVQLTLAVNLREYDEWRGRRSEVGKALCANLPTFYDAEVESVVRWLPGEPFDASQAEENMNHKAMDSWYLHHALFNLSRLATQGERRCRDMLERSLPYAIRVAHRFDYRWPIFFHLRSLDIIRAEAAPGKGGETDVAGLYALVMIHAHELFGEQRYLQEAEIAASRLHGLGFNLAYQLNTTGFAAEATMRLWKLTGKRRYLGLSEICMANIFDNMWLWRCEYGRAKRYMTFFGLFPLREAPYIAAYEELEAQAKAFEYLELGGDDVRPSLKLLLAEYQKYALDRTWFYYPDALPSDALCEKSRNGRVELSLSIPLEDVHDGFEACGEVGQEVYGAGLPFVLTSRYFRRLSDGDYILHCNYPIYDFSTDGGDDERATSFRIGGDQRGTCQLRVMPAGPDVAVKKIEVTTLAGTVQVGMTGKVTAEGHALFELRGGQTAQVTCAKPERAGAKAVIIGSLAASC